MSVDDDERQASPGARQAGRVARRAPGSPARAAGRWREEFDLYYVRTGRKSAHPLVIIPGGPGAASIAPLPGVSATRRGRGSRRDHGRASRRRDVPPRRQRLRPAARGADHRSGGRRRRRRPRRRPGGQGSHLRHLVRHVRRRRCRCAAPGSGARDGARFTRVVGRTTSTTCAMRRVACCGMATTPRPPTWRPRFASSSTARCSRPRPPSWPRRSTASPGPRCCARQLDLLLAGRPWLWSALGRAARFLFERKAPYRHEPDLVGRIGYRELNYGAVPDGKPLDPAVAFREFATGPTDFEAEPYDLVAEMPKFSWPTVVISGGRDLITPPSVARRVASLIPGAVLVNLADRRATASSTFVSARRWISSRLSTTARATGLPARADTAGLDTRRARGPPAGLGHRRRGRRREGVARRDSAYRATGYGFMKPILV